MLRAQPHAAVRRTVQAPRSAAIMSTRPKPRGEPIGVAADRAVGDSKTGDVKTWTATVGSSAPLLDDNSKGILFSIVDRSGAESVPASLDEWKPATTLYEDENKGWKRAGDVLVPRDFKDPVALKLFKKPGVAKDGSPEILLDYVSEFRLDMGSSQLAFPVHSWFSSEHKWRVFFGPKAYLPSETPDTLVPFRQQDLAELRGENLKPEQLKAKRQGADRVYGYQVYDDLGSEKAFRPALGGSAKFPYPRRIATNRRQENGQEVNVGKDPCNPPESGPWMPYDERFNYSKQQGFNGDALLAVVPAVVQGIKHIPVWKLALGAVYQVLRRVPLVGSALPPKPFPPVEDFQDFEDVLDLYGKDITAKGGSVKAMIAPLRQHMYPKGSEAAAGKASGASSSNTARRFKEQGHWDFKLSPEEAHAADEAAATAAAGPAVRSSLAKSAAGTSSAPAAAAKGDAALTNIEALPSPDLKTILGYASSVLKKNASAGRTLTDQLTEFSVPRSLEDRPLAWDLDEEVGRQAVAGMHPCTLTALTQLPQAIGSAIRNEHVVGDLQGSSLEDLVNAAAAGGKPRLYLMDYWALSAFWDQTAPDANMVQHAGRALFYLRRRVVDGRVSDEDEALIPVAIELATRDTAVGKAGEVYSRAQLTADPKTAIAWRLAKAIFRSLDSMHHQLISHWLRTHACMEPFLIGMRRQMSFMHPVFKLMLPHFRYTMHINANARATLVNAQGIIESVFSCGEFAMRLTSEAYRTWRFRTQALPEDLKQRGMIDPKTGKPWMEYPYAEDGMDLWRAYEDYFGAFLSRHYRNDAALLADSELQAWWTEAKTVGHGDLLNFNIASEEDIWGFSGPIATQQQLVRVLTTIAFTASAHHAAVNFGQYDFSGLILNFSSMVRKPMPSKGDKAWQELVNAPLGERQEKLLMSWLVHVVGAATAMTTVKLLSNHAEGEQTLDVPNKYFKGTDDEALNAEFVSKVLALEKDFEKRNANPKSWTRAATALNPNTMAYTLLLPTSDSGNTGRGVPYSVSI